LLSHYLILVKIFILILWFYSMCVRGNEIHNGGQFVMLGYCLYFNLDVRWLHYLTPKKFGILLLVYKVQHCNMLVFWMFQWKHIIHTYNVKRVWRMSEWLLKTKWKNQMPKKEEKHTYKFTVPHVWTHLYVHKIIMQGIYICV